MGWSWLGATVPDLLNWLSHPRLFQPTSISSGIAGPLTKSRNKRLVAALHFFFSFPTTNRSPGPIHFVTISLIFAHFSSFSPDCLCFSPRAVPHAQLISLLLPCTFFWSKESHTNISACFFSIMEHTKITDFCFFKDQSRWLYQRL